MIVQSEMGGGGLHVCVLLYGAILLQFSPGTDLLSALSSREGACWVETLTGNEADIYYFIRNMKT